MTVFAVYTRVYGEPLAILLHRSDEVLNGFKADKVTAVNLAGLEKTLFDVVMYGLRCDAQASQSNIWTALASSKKRSSASSQQWPSKNE